MMRDYLTEKERVSKNSKSFFYKVYDRRIASEIIKEMVKNKQFGILILHGTLNFRRW